jgi:hypothetical protein
MAGEGSTPIANLIDNGDLVINDGYRAKNSGLSAEGLPFARAQNINNGFRFEDADCFPRQDLHKVGLKVSQPGDVVFTSKGTVGRFAFVQEDTPRFVYAPQLCFWWSLNHKKIFPRWLYYWMQSWEFFTQYSGVAGQTDMAEYVSLRDQRQMHITLPPLEEQQAIAHILGALDDKIELNRRMNETLEGIAQALFKSWFVDFDPVRAKAAGQQPPGLAPHIADLFPDEFEESELGEIPGRTHLGGKSAMSAFDTFMNDYQVAWRAEQVESQEQGWQNGKQYPWILPRRLWESSLWPGIRSRSDHSLLAYLREHGVQKHSGVHNLKSSWVLCANLYFPFRASDTGRDLLARFLQAYVSPAIHTVDAVELEYEESGSLHPSVLLGEEDGGRGAGQTSPDIAFLVNGGRGLVLVENKFVEHSFYACSARTHKGSRNREGNPDPSRCNDVPALLDAPQAVCHQVAWGRRYWDHLAPVINREKALSLRCCPAARAGYQLLRQHALAEGIAASGKYDRVVSCLALDERNETLQRCLRSTGIADVREWGKLFPGKAGFAVFSHQDWVAWVLKHDHTGGWSGWLDYVKARYGYGGLNGWDEEEPILAEVPT